MTLAIWRKPSNSQLSLWKSLNKARARLEEGLLLAEGFKVVTELMRSPWQVRALLVLEEKKAQWDTFLASLQDNMEVYSLTAHEWKKLSQDKKPEGIMAVAAPDCIRDVTFLPDTGHILLAYRINNPNNLGALARTAHWFGFGALPLSSDSVDFTNPKAIRASMGSLFHLRLIPDVDFTAALPHLKERYFLVAGHTRKGVLPHPCSRRTALLLGSESHGLPDSLMEWTDEMWSIPGAGEAESLSLPQAAAIMMYETARKAP